jgi:hypothetical protein
MAGDYTRMTFRSAKDHSGVLMQQGRVTLDADWNELVDVTDHRLRAGIVDALGRCVFSRETPDAFLISLGGGALTIGRGRAYVDGILAECHGAGVAAFDPVLAEDFGVDPVDYLKQPYYPNPDPLPATGTYVAYLDVWKREVTALEDPDLVEKAIGIDTATRIQNAWQVRLLEGTGDMDCDTQLSTWDALTAPSAGRLTTTAVGVPVSTDPCTIPPSGGYRGTENRLYRVEIHDAGPLGTATFKWSHDNASIASHVEAIDASRTTLTVTRLGRDDVRRLSVDDWVEVTDDWRELHGLAGELRKVATVDEVNETLTLATALPAGEFDATDPARHTRVIRWDQAGAAVDAAGGLVRVPAVAGTAFVLEDGVQVAFDIDPAGGSFHVGDYWVFAARTADASVEQLVDEPPHGVTHHVCRLGIVTFPGGPVIDCRRPPEEACCDCACDVCITPESHASGALTIQMGVDQVAKTGGKICLQVGLYRLERPVLIRGARSIELVGKGWKTILLSTGRLPAIVVEGSVGVTIDRMTIVAGTLSRRGAVPSGIAILLRTTIGTIIERCVLVQLGLVQQPPPGEDDPGTPGDPGTPAPCPPDNLKVAINTHAIADGTTDLGAMFGPKGAGAPLIALDGIVIETLIQENLLVGTSGIGTLWGLVSTGLAWTAMDSGLDNRIRTSEATAVAGGSGYLLTYDLTIDDNRLLCWLNGIALEGFSMQLGETRIHGNSALVCLRAGIVTTGFTGPGGRIDVTGNILSVLGYGIVAGTDDTRIVDNDVTRITGFGSRSGEGSTVGLSSYAFVGHESSAAAYLAFFGGDAIVLAPSLRPTGIDRAQVRGNRVLGVVGNGIAIRTTIVSAQIADNQVQTIGGHGVTTEGKAIARLLGIERNQILNVGLLAREGGTVGGILVGDTDEITIAGNTVEGVGVLGISASRRYGIATSACRAVRITGNVVANVGPPNQFTGLAAGIAVLDGFAHADVLDNTSRRGDTLHATPVSDWIGILIGDPFRDAVTNADLAAGKVFLTEGALIHVNAAAGHVISLPLNRPSLGVRGNLVEAYGQSPAVYVDTRALIVFSDNRCFLLSRGAVTAFVRGEAAVAGNNILDGPAKFPALELEVAGAFTLLGNVTSSPISVNGAAPPPAPWTTLNT